MSGRYDDDILSTVVIELQKGNTLDRFYRDHSLSGDLSTFRECHLLPDLLLIYEVDKKLNEIILHKIGSHSELFH